MKASLRVHLETFGCQMNEYDSELARRLLENEGYSLAAENRGADVLLFNTCAVRETANTRIYARLHALRREKARRPTLVVGVLGCIAQNLGTELLDRFEAVDFVCGPDAYRELPALIARARAERRRGAAVELSEYETYADIAPARVAGVNAWIAVMRGCNNFCTFCVVPYTRGRERSRDPEGIVAEARQLAAEGHPQVTLLGQNVNSYRHGATDFAALIRRVADVDGIARVRFTSPHPKDFPLRLLEAIAEHPRICKAIHLPLQAGSDRILAKMHRGYTRARYRELVARMRQTIPGLVLTTDVICGFPTETEAEFQETEAVLAEVRFQAAFIFKYSQRPGTVAARRYADDVPEEEKSRRVTRLVALQREISRARNEARVGTVARVLVEGASRKDAGMWRARTDAGAIVVFRDPARRVGEFAQVRIVRATPHTLVGEPV
ncbi:MAG: tRNA (N6-isopentenyl adenosine(37)-C2)-methylthiotransferase MiaB [Planctomycetes bacterium]|nr:tRNA (N6-isopentenyl adenosine(37)-C2)-methylthiotransferase MiaB [Planctomycetota bacterium]